MSENLVGSPLHRVVIELKQTLHKSAEIVIAQLDDDHELLQMFTRKELIDRTVREEVHRILLERFHKSLPPQYDAEDLAKALVDMVCESTVLH